jgi:hypothetical protein
VVLYDAVSGLVLRRDGVLGDPAVRDVDFSPDGQRLLVARGSDLVLRDARTGVEITRLDACGYPIYRGVFAPDGNSLIVGVEQTRPGDTMLGEMTAVLFLDAHTGEQQREMPACAETFDQIASLPRWPRLARSANLETEILGKQATTAHAWFTPRLSHLVADPTGRKWAGSWGKYLFLFQIEGLV